MLKSRRGRADAPTVESLPTLRARLAEKGAVSWLIASFAAFWFAVVVVSRLHPMGEPAAIWADAFGSAVAALVAAIAAAIRSGRQDDPGRRAWIWMAGASACWSTAQGCAAVLLLVGGRSPETASEVTAISLGGYVFGTVAMAVLAASGTGGARLTGFVDALLVATSLLYVMWASVLGSIWAIHTRDLGMELGRFEVAGDLVLALSAVLAIRRARTEDRAPAWLAGLGALGVAAIDAASWQLGQTGGTSLNLLHALRPAAFLLIAAGAVWPTPIPHEKQAKWRERFDGGADLVQAFLPLAAVVGAGAVVIDRSVHQAASPPSLVAISTMAFLLLIARQAVAVGDAVKLRRAIEHGQEELARQKAEMAHQSVHDATTGLANRILLEDRINHALLRQARSDTTLAVLMCDLDGFREVNDSVGHAGGDEALRIIGQRVRRCLRRSDTVARLSGDEIAVLLEDLAGPEIALAASERIGRVIAEPIEISGRKLAVTASIGIALAGNQAHNAQELLRDADVALHEAKASGKNCSRVCDDHMLDDVVRRLQLDRDLHDAAYDPTQMVVHYQPLVDTITGQVTGVEALVRWYHPQFGLLLPGSFLARAEETGLIVPLGNNVIREACAQLARWRAEGIRCPTIAVNLSTRQLRSVDTTRVVKEALAESSIDAGQLVLDVTEAITTLGTSTLGRVLEELHELGAKIAIDDFGTASTLASLQELPVDQLKIGAGFTARLGTAAPSMAQTARSAQGAALGEDLREGGGFRGPGIATANRGDVVNEVGGGATVVDLIVKAAQRLGIGTVVKGVERSDQLTVARLIGCDQAQGFLIARPGPADEVAPLLRLGAWQPGIDPHARASQPAAG